MLSKRPKTAAEMGGTSPELDKALAVLLPKPRPAERLIAAAKEAVAIAKGEAEPAAVHVRPHVRVPKKQITLRLDVDVIATFKATGDGWQSRINEALRKAMP